jgi:hypothetical protein
MESGITDSDRLTMLRAAVARVEREEMKAALARTADPAFQIPKAVGNALNALRKNRDPVGVVDKPQFRAVLPYVAAVIADRCLSATIEALGENSDDPTREQLLAALEEVRATFSDVTIAVMLASVADADMPSSDLCFDIAATDERFSLSQWAEHGTTAEAPEASDRSTKAVTPEQRESRRLKKQRDADERRKKLDAARRAGEQVRRAKKLERVSGSPVPGATAATAVSAAKSTVPTLTRRATLTPAQEAEFDRGDPWVAGVVFAWIPFTAPDPAEPGLEGKSRRCVVVAGSPGELLVRAGYSEGGAKSRDWKSVPLSHWKRAGFDQPTWVDTETVRVPRDDESKPVGWLVPEDWNALW